LDAFLDGKANHLKDHPRFLNYNYEFKSKAYPTLEEAKSLIDGVSQ
jgi:aminoglycoside/choline kinase family phosphotransferase